MNETEAIACLESLKTLSGAVAHQQAQACLLTFLEAHGHGALVAKFRELAKQHGVKV